MSYANINGYNTEIREINIRQNTGTITVFSYFIDKKNTVFIFHSFCSKSTFEQHFSNFQKTMGSFSQIKNKQAKAKKPIRLNIIVVSENGTLEQILAKHPSTVLEIDELALLNGKHLTDNIQAGERIKILSE